MKTMSSHSLRQRPGSTGKAAAHKTSSLQFSVPSSGRGGTASTSGRGQFTLAPVRAVRLANRGVSNEAAALQQGGLGLSELLDKDLAEPVLTPRRIMNRRIKSCRSLASLADLVLNEISNFDHQNVSHALSRLAKMVQGRTRSHGRRTRSTTYSAPSRQQQIAELTPAVDVLTQRMHQLIRNYDSWDLTLSLWAYAQLGYHDESALRALCEAALAVTPIFKPADCANAVVAFAYLDYLHTELLRQVVAVVLESIDDFQPGEVCQVLWGFAKMGCHPGASLLHEAVSVVHRNVRQYGTQELVLVLWALVRLAYKPGVRFLYDVETTLVQRLPHMAPADFSLSVWTLAHLRYKAVRLLDEVPAAVGPQLRNCSNAELCSLASGFATAHHYHRVLLDAVAGVVLSRIESLTHQEVCIVLWTYGTFRHRPVHGDFSKQMAATLYSRMPYFAPQGLAMIVKALAQLQWRSEPLLAALITAAEAKLNAFKPLELSQLLWGLTALECKDLNIYYAVVRRCIAILKDPLHPYYRTMMHHRVVNSVIASCQQLGYVPWTLIDFAESKGIRVKEPGILSSRDEDDEGMLLPGRPAGAGAVAATAIASATGITATATGRDPAAISCAWPDRGEVAAGYDRHGQEELEAGEKEIVEAGDEDEDDVGTSMAANLAAGIADGRQRRGASERSSSKQLLQLQEQQQHSQEEQGSWQDRRSHSHPVNPLAELDQRAPQRIGFAHQHHHHGNGHSRGHSHSHHKHQHAYAHGGSEAGEGEGEGVKVLIPRPRAPRRSSAGVASAAAAAHAPPLHGGKPPPPPPPLVLEQHHTQDEQACQKQRRYTSGVAAPVPLSPPPPPLQQQQLGLRVQGHGHSNGNGSSHCLPEAPWVALER
ncbi:hypothetical protein Vretimale_17077 [Volvox reticuliferus]|uniref:RNA-editing substrate-binding complex 6 protein domain-containing protein n=1 Tax=Volvox reticuliferus TaxID=1737510 RepID=A0A8J4GU97_9CHLO|nr:hypothetical protein Vretifemale_18677 [Volvox reticuliferus]GIM14049.1 hypothetical protein Vretimale_17077 [Volvox reticuliferus]